MVLRDLPSRRNPHAFLFANVRRYFIMFRRASVPPAFPTIPLCILTFFHMSNVLLRHHSYLCSADDMEPGAMWHLPPSQSQLLYTDQQETLL